MAKKNKEVKEKDSTTKTTTKRREKFTLNTILHFTAFIGIGCIAIALLLTVILKGNTKLSYAFNKVGEVIAYVISMLLAFFWVKSHKSIPWIVLYVVFVVTIVILFILTISF